jgi:hypothetical protein
MGKLELTAVPAAMLAREMMADGVEGRRLAIPRSKLDRVKAAA